ncbi:MAG: hypothetical protein K0S41_3404 [Anaerocolumna sp.]|jgi:hypothetical protein|nr:hypothetical protein [Anaerocolumna sp.]
MYVLYNLRKLPQRLLYANFTQNEASYTALLRGNEIQNKRDPKVL